MGGSPCTHWSIAQKNNRETEPSGAGWELFKNFLIAKDKYQPDYFLYENNKSASQHIKDEISKRLGVSLQYINSALVSAQNRQRFYAHNIMNVTQPSDRKIPLRDVLDNNDLFKETEPLEAITTDAIRIGDLPNGKGEISGSQATRIYSINGKSVNLIANGGGQGAKTGLYAIPVFENIDTKKHHVYKVENGLMLIKDKEYPIKLTDGFYLIRNLSVNECKRLQTIPDWYEFPVSNAQAYKMLGNGWTVEIIKWILSHIPNIQNEEIEILSMFDGMSCGQIALRELECNITKYYATEIDKYAIKTTQYNFPYTIQLGDALKVREDSWVLN